MKIRSIKSSLLSGSLLFLPLTILSTNLVSAHPLHNEPKNGGENKEGKKHPIIQYKNMDIQGWKLHADPTILGTSEWEACKTHINFQLFMIKNTLPKEIVERMQKVPIFFDGVARARASACYHPSLSWLKANGYDPRKAKSVELSNPKSLIRSFMGQPCVMLHELAHAYHDQVLGFNYAPIVETYKKAMETKKYDQVLRPRGTRKVKHYAASNHKEYFAEAVEAYFGTNDYYPFVRSELKEFDPAMHDLVEKIFKKK